MELSKEAQDKRDKYSSVQSMSEEEPDIISTIVDYSKFKHEAVADEYPYHVNALFSLSSYHNKNNYY